MPRHINIQKRSENLRLAPGKSGNRDVLYHGTRYAQSILKTGVLLHGDQEKVCLTRSAEVAAYWALIDRGDDEGRGSILIFDRQSLERRYKIEANPEAFWHSETIFHDEAEEEVKENIVHVANHLIGCVSSQSRVRRLRKAASKVRTKWKRERKAEIEDRLLTLAR